ncbi:unnamed protein product [Lasius platythorax]|uniref:Uncharacterized protein n=1 Tax=Lasius platythorax TaxID=488582 RepID=A0AAV2MYR6_9HYME
MQESSYLSTNSSRIPKREKNKITKGSKKLYKKNETQLKCKRTRWSNAEKDIVLIQFGTYLNTYKCPSFKEIAALIAANPCLQTRTVYQ